MTFNFEKYFFGKTQRNDFSDNDSCRMAAFFVQDGRCYVTGVILRSGERQLHHRLPKSKGGKDTPENLIFLESRVHKMVHTNNYDEYWNLEKELKLTAAQSKMVEQLRYEAGSYFYV